MKMSGRLDLGGLRRWRWRAFAGHDQMRREDGRHCIEQVVRIERRAGFGEQSLEVEVEIVAIVCNPLHQTLEREDIVAAAQEVGHTAER